jgi:DNA mismatch repair protein MutL
MASKIRVLTDHTINQIAAGEVVENPSSVVKELVENSLDAGASEICVEIKGGGRQLIRVTDNGCGMSQDDALLCLERHATSKIREVDDLFSIGTMGFRGEAIPSIAAISKFTLMTRQTESEPNSLGTMVIVDGGRIFKCCPVASPPGTSIEIKSLFFNVPVRKKFQKSPIYDANEIYKILCLLALGNPTIKFQLISNEKNMLLAPMGELGERISSVLGPEYFDAMLPLEGRKGECLLEGFIGLPTFTRQNRTGQYLFVNKRAVFSSFISYTIREGYGPAIGSHRHPVFVLNLTMPGNLVDVNVHPQKKEVRLRQEYLLKDTIIQAVEKAMRSGHEPSFLEAATPPLFELPVMPTVSFPQPAVSFYQMESPYFFSPSPTPPSPRIIEESKPLSLFERPMNAPTPRVITTIPSYIIVDPVSFDKFGKEGLCLVDQRAAHSRIVFEKLSHENKERSIPMQSLLIPYTLHSTVLLAEQIDLLNSFGISIRECGPRIFIIDAIPQAFGNTDVKEFVEEIVQNMHEISDKTAHQIAAAASRAAISKNKRLSFEEAQVLLNQLMRCQLPYQCPFGKPIIKLISSDQLAKQFN